MSRDVHSCSHQLRPCKTPIPPHLGSYTRGAIGQLRKTTSPCNPLGFAPTSSYAVFGIQLLTILGEYTVNYKNHLFDFCEHFRKNKIVVLILRNFQIFLFYLCFATMLFLPKLYYSANNFQLYFSREGEKSSRFVSPYWQSFYRKSTNDRQLLNPGQDNK